MEATFPARLHVLLAPKARYGLVIRRGPSKLVCFIGWNLATNTFQPAQWFKGRIYERRSDLSPDGKHLIYFAMNGKWQSETKGSWTAISKYPWMKSIALYAKGDCWHGGGLFLDKKSFWLNDGYGHKILQATSVLQQDKSYIPDHNFGGECPGVYYLRLIRDGWTLLSHKKIDRRSHLTIFEKRSGHATLQKYAHEQVDQPEGKGCYWDEHILLPADRPKIECPDWEWADFVGSNLYYASKGCLHHINTRKKTFDILNAEILYDFNSLKFEESAAPY